MSAKEMQYTAVQTTTHDWGYRELDISELQYVGGGDAGDGGVGADGGDGDGGDGGGGTNASDSGGAGTGGRGCTSADTTASCNARTEGYARCDALGYGIEAAAQLFGGSAAQNLAAQVGPSCRVGIDNVVDAFYRTEMYEQRNQGFSPISYGVDDTR